MDRAVDVIEGVIGLMTCTHGWNGRVCTHTLGWIYAFVYTLSFLRIVSPVYQRTVMFL